MWCQYDTFCISSQKTETDMDKEFKSFFKKVEGNEGARCHYSTRLDTYGCGCSHDCSYCYAKSLLDFRRLWNPSDPASANVGKVIRLIRRKVYSGVLKKGDIVRLGGMTDCFQGVELERRVTYKTIEELNRQGIGYLIVTKSDLVAREEYRALMRKDLAHIQISITTTDDELAKTYEKAPSPTRRIRAIETLQNDGFDVCVRISPFIPEYVDLRRINAIRCDKALVEFLRVSPWVQRWFDIDYSQYTLSHAGYKHLPLEVKRELIKGIDGFKEVSVCEDVPEHWEWWRDNFNHNAEDCCNLRKETTKNE